MSDSNQTIEQHDETLPSEKNESEVDSRVEVSASNGLDTRKVSLSIESSRLEDIVMVEPKGSGKIDIKTKNEPFAAELLQVSEDVKLETQDIPISNEEAINFLNSLEGEDLENLTFSEQLVTTSDNGDLGEFLISIEKSVFEEQECYYIIAKSMGYVEGVMCGTSFTSYVNKQMQTLEQRHHEYVKVSPFPLDRKTLVQKKDGIYHFTKMVTEGQETYQIEKAWKEEDLPALVLEGANTLLARALVTKNHVPIDFRVTTIDSDGYLCQSEYKSLAETTIEVNNEDVPVIGLERTIFSKVDSPISWHYYLMDDGHLITRVQIGSLVKMKVTKVPLRITSGEFLTKPTFKKRPLDWEEDMELKSKYMDKKGKFMNDFSVYMQQKPEVRALLADFLQFLLLRKPDDVVDFAADYFSSFSSRLPQTQSFMTSNADSAAGNATLYKKQ